MNSKIQLYIVILLSSVTGIANASIIYLGDYRSLWVSSAEGYSYSLEPSTPFSTFNQRIIDTSVEVFQYSLMDYQAISGFGSTMVDPAMASPSSEAISKFFISFTVDTLSDYVFNLDLNDDFGNAYAQLDSSVSNIIYTAGLGRQSFSGQLSPGETYTLFLQAYSSEVYFAPSSYDFGFEVLPATVPVPAAAWLFGSGLIGLFGVARRKKV